MAYPLKNWKKIKRGYRFGEKTYYNDKHLGLDMIIPEGTDIFMPFDSEVIRAFAGLQGGKTAWLKFTDQEYGKLIMRFMHLSDLPKKGIYKEGVLICHTGRTGKYCRAPHLHIDISRGDVKIKEFKNFIDPEKFLMDRNSQKRK